MLTEKEAQEYRVLSIINSADFPMGSGAISKELKAAGLDISEATVGRILSSLDHRGYTQRVGYQGRILSKEGKGYLKKLEAEKKRVTYGYELLDTLRSTGKSHLLDILTARRGIERELARLAAINATDAEIKEMMKVLKEQTDAVERGQDGAAGDVNFHRLLAKMAKNKVLDAAMELIRQDGQLAPVLSYIRNKVQSLIVVDHQKIADAVAARNPEAAEKAMVEHIEKLMNDVNKYWSKAEKTKS